MGRLAKKGLDYFPMDVDMFQDIRIRKLIKYQGGAAVSVYTLLLCRIYKDGYYMRWDNEVPFIVSENTGLDENRVSEVIKCCLSIGLFDKSLYEKERILTSRSIQQRYCNIKRLNKHLARVDEYKLIDEQPTSAKRKQAIGATQEDKTSTTNKTGKVLPSPPATTTVQESKSPSELNAKYMQDFFRENRTESLNVLCKNLGMRKADLEALRKTAEAVIAEWELSDIPHSDYRDWSRHLIATMRKRMADMKKGQPDNAASPPQATPPDYTYNGGFGGQDT